MIVIATNNGTNELKLLLNSLQNTSQEILIVDTGSDDIEHINYLKKLNRTFKYEITKSPNKNYDTGAYIWAYQNFKANYYHFIHDSITIKKHTFFGDVENLLLDCDVVGYIKFNFMGYGCDIWKKIFEKNTGGFYYEYGIFGPMFSIKNASFASLDIERIALPTNKIEQTAFEGIWFELFKKQNLNLVFLDEFNITKILNDEYKNFKKTFLNRG